MNREDRIKALYGKKTPVIPQKGETVILPPSPKRQAWLKGNLICMEFPKDREVINIVKRITQRKYIDGTSLQYWEAPVSLDCLDKLSEAGFTIDESIKTWRKKLFNPVVFNPNFKIPGIKHFDYFEQYQIEGVQIIEAKKGRALLADDKGLGKTMIVLSWLQLRLDVRPVLIICPAIAKLTWLAEIDFWMDGLDTVQVISGTKQTVIDSDITIINYDILTHIKDKQDVVRADIWNVDWKCVILDEGHYACNNETIRGWAIEQLVTNVPHVIVITASPGRNRPKDIFPLANIVNKEVFPSFYKFAHKYCDPKIGYKGKWDFNGSSNETELHELLTSTIMIRRKKSDLFKDVRKRRFVVPLQIDNREEYDKADEDFSHYLQTQGKCNIAEHTFAKIEHLKQMAVKGKMNDAIQWIEELLETEDKVVIFAEHKFVLDALQKAFGKIAVRVDGTNNDMNKREAARQAFQKCGCCGVLKERHSNSPESCKEYVYDLAVRVFLGSRAAITNITLTAAYHVVFMELWHSPEDHDQGEDRVFCRKGDVHDATCWYLVAHDTFEENQAAVFDIKNKNLTKIMDGKELTKQEMLTELLKEYRRTH